MKSILLIGLNKFGSLLAKRFYELGHEVMAVDRNEDLVNCILPYVTDAQIGDCTNETFLRSLGIPSYDLCVVTIGSNFQNSLETTSLLKELGGKYVVSRADRERQARFLLRNGADEVINPDQQIADWAAIKYTANHILDYVKLDDDHAIFEVTVPNDWRGKSIGKINIRKKYGINILAVKRNGQMNYTVLPDMVLDATNSILVLGELKVIQKCFHL